MATNLRIWVNEDLQGNHVGILLEGAELIEIKGQLYPMIELSPAYALHAAEAITQCVEQIMERFKSKG